MFTESSVIDVPLTKKLRIPKKLFLDNERMVVQNPSHAFVSPKVSLILALWVFQISKLRCGEIGGGF